MEGVREEDKRRQINAALCAIAIVRGFGSERVSARELFDFMVPDASAKDPDADEYILEESRARARAAELERLRESHGDNR